MGIIKDTLIKYKLTTDKEHPHSYGDAYDMLFQDRLNKKNNILEIGIYMGGSIKAWSECFPKSTIYGVDITLQNLKHNFDDDKNVKIIEQDINYLEFEEELDIIIDDGSHYIDDVVSAFDFLYPKLKVGGMYVIEDVQEAGKWDEEIKERVGDGANVYAMDLRYNSKIFEDAKGELELEGGYNSNGGYDNKDNYLIIIEKHK